MFRQTGTIGAGLLLPAASSPGGRGYTNLMKLRLAGCGGVLLQAAGSTGDAQDARRGIICLSGCLRRSADKDTGGVSRAARNSWEYAESIRRLDLESRPTDRAAAARVNEGSSAHKGGRASARRANDSHTLRGTTQSARRTLCKGGKFTTIPSRMKLSGEDSTSRP